MDNGIEVENMMTKTSEETASHHTWTSTLQERPIVVENVLDKELNLRAKRTELRYDTAAMLGEGHG